MSGSGSPAASLVGRFLVAAPSMPDERFQKSVVFICKHDDDGALGIIVKPTTEWGGNVGYQHWWLDNLRSNVNFGRTDCRRLSSRNGPSPSTGT